MMPRPSGILACCVIVCHVSVDTSCRQRETPEASISCVFAGCLAFYCIQVKWLSKCSPVPLGKTLDKIMGDRWIIVNNAMSETPATFIMFPDEVRERAHRGEKDDRVSYWLQPRDYNQDQFRE